ncbi:hypothetical protein BH10PSE17_BH10PSE17_31600 [soil metagenome]
MARKSAAERESEITGRLLKHWHEAVPNDRMAHLAKDATRSFLRSLQVRLARHDVTLGQWTYLRILWERDGITQRELSHEAGVMESSTVIALRSLEAMDFVRRDRIDGDRRSYYVYLTARGKALKRKLVPLAEEVNAVALRGLKASEIETTRQCLLVMLDNLASDAALAGDAD